MRHDLFNLSAKVRENIGGICWVIRIGGTSAGNCASNLAIASVPPVDAPIAIRRFGFAGLSKAGAGSGATLLCSFARAAPRMLAETVARKSPTEYGPLGFASTSTAP